MEKKIIIKTKKIQLDQFLKWADVIQSGGQIRELLDEKKIYINGILCLEKRKQLHINDVVEIKKIGIFRVSGE
ncbi:MAG: RNA-binding S4 domain-containing protein [Megasphaera sp.]|jgi:ribosome-associated protein|uniref:RNA-binding S4 domain-containing protein n=1 Tax=Megasphaera sueciensis TaxID=349094 RepID=UPI002ACB09B3|nr:RNA-binding S4 domain-containing protein [Megasphaera sp.]MCI1823496.1 RNA-binding S4 domain-containing protein [Megasphaera sp.]